MDDSTSYSHVYPSCRSSSSGWCNVCVRISVYAHMVRSPSILTWSGLHPSSYSFTVITTTVVRCDAVTEKFRSVYRIHYKTMKNTDYEMGIRLYESRQREMKWKTSGRKEKWREKEIAIDFTASLFYGAFTMFFSSRPLPW